MHVLCELGDSYTADGSPSRVTAGKSYSLLNCRSAGWESQRGQPTCPDRAVQSVESIGLVGGGAVHGARDATIATNATLASPCITRLVGRSDKLCAASSYTQRCHNTQMAREQTRSKPTKRGREHNGVTTTRRSR